MPASPPAKRSRTERQSVAAFLFRRDLRVQDNTALLALHEAAAAASIPILPLFFFNPQQADKNKNPYFGDACFQFMCESLVDLDRTQLAGKLVCLRGSDTSCLETVHNSGLDIALLGYNEDFSPFALQRDERLSEWCERKGVRTVTSADDYTLLPHDTVRNGSDQPYSVFTPFYNCVMAQHRKKIRAPRPELVLPSAIYSHGKRLLGAAVVDPAEVFTPVPLISDHGGRAEGVRRLAAVAGLKKYEEVRDYVALDATTHLSPHLKFGTVSVREAWAAATGALGPSHAFTRQLVWREFYSMLLVSHPRLVAGQIDPAKAQNDPFAAKYHGFKWKWREEELQAFVAGRTGVPLVDAAVRCLTATGWCHNRARMIIANFLVKVLFVDWRVGERWYASVAVDYDVANNSGGWQWSSGQGADAQPYFRTFNPFRQSARFDAEATFIKRWIPELAHVPAAVIHKWDEYCAKSKHKPCSEAEMEAAARQKPSAAKPSAKSKVVYRTTYPSPIVDIKERTQKVIAEFKKYDR